MLNRAGVGAGDDVLVTGASGGVGTGLVQLARRRGARVLGLTSSGKADSVREIGADEIVARDEEEELDGTRGLDRGRTRRRRGRRRRRRIVSGVPRVASAGRRRSDRRCRRRPCHRDRPSDGVSEVSRRRRVDDGDAKRVPDLVRYIEDGDVEPLLAETYPLSKSTRRNVTSPGAITSGTSSWSRKRPLRPLCRSK